MNNSDPRSSGNPNEEQRVDQQNVMNDPAMFPHMVAENKRRSNNSVLITIIICATVIVLCILGFILYYAVLDKETSNKENQKIENTSTNNEVSNSDEGVKPLSAEEYNALKKHNSGESAKKAPTRQQTVAALSNVGFTDDYSYIVCEVPLDASDLQYLTKTQLRILRNTIYARHGRKFKSADLREYFSNFSWYTPLYDEISPYSLSKVEKHNIELIKKYE